ncbi:hypothetical protein FD723_39710 (plasmid) [Nostoc sp. C052]|uniref:hypothetical protein n=1 Tax=Nostoc sp. C052 TaxID=2576902 RepID=UPI0015C3D3F9|nr:hypothetical protein [Nostoc sp. C052]QLE46339.1 hypothetical protein FD723_39710 [Nostoc sp. C052]
MPNLQQFSDSELAGDYKARGIDRQSSYSQFVKDRNLNPGIDAKDFFEIYDQAIAKLINRYIVNEKIEGMTHILIETYSDMPKHIKLLKEDEIHIQWVTDFGMTGSTGKAFIKSLEPIEGDKMTEAHTNTNTDELDNAVQVLVEGIRTYESDVWSSSQANVTVAEARLAAASLIHAWMFDKYGVPERIDGGIVASLIEEIRDRD